MTRDDVVRMARAEGIEMPSGPFPARGSFTLPDLLGFVASIAASEREACAKVCDDSSHRDDDMGAIIGRKIRART